jgi:hypothetical protein
VEDLLGEWKVAKVKREYIRLQIDWLRKLDGIFSDVGLRFLRVLVTPSMHCL